MKNRLAGQFLQHYRRIQRAPVSSDGGVARAGFEAALPLAGTLDIEIEGKILQHGQDCTEGPLRGGNVVRPMSVADGDVGSHLGGNPLRTRHEREHKTNAAQVRPDFLRFGGIRIGNPDVDVNVMIQSIGQRY